MSKGRSVPKQCMSKEHQIAPSDVEMVTISKHLLELLLKGPQLVSEAVIHAKTVANKIILTQRDELQRLVDAWAQGNSEALFTACLGPKNTKSNEEESSRWRDDDDNRGGRCGCRNA